MRAQSLFEGSRMTLAESLELTAQSLSAYADRYRHWTVAYSGGKDSSATVTAVAYLIEQGLVPKPESLAVLYADTRLELPPLQESALAVLNRLKACGIETEIVYPKLDDRFFVYMFGRGVPPPSNTFRWCTSQIKIEPMQAALERQAVSLGFGEMIWDERKARHVYWGFGKDKLLTITGVRLGESAARDARIAMSCSRDGAECGQGWLQQSPKENLNDTLAPLLHWRVCQVWDWLMGWSEFEHGFPTQGIAETYGLNEDGSNSENGTRTGCVGCNLASRDTALDTLLLNPRWQYLEPYKRLKPLYAELKRPGNRLRQFEERRKDGSLAANQGRLGPLTMEARYFGIESVLAIQNEINAAARQSDRPKVSLINAEELSRIVNLIEAGTWPNGWTGKEPVGSTMLPELYGEYTELVDGVEVVRRIEQPLLFGNYGLEEL